MIPKITQAFSYHHKCKMLSSGLITYLLVLKSPPILLQPSFWIKNGSTKKPFHFFWMLGLTSQLALPASGLSLLLTCTCTVRLLSNTSTLRQNMCIYEHTSMISDSCRRQTALLVLQWSPRCRCASRCEQSALAIGTCLLHHMPSITHS